MSNVSRITGAHGDGIAPEIMNACLHIIQSAGARIEPSAWESKAETLGNFDGQTGCMRAQGR
jgi:hypothetical protein